MWYSLNLTLIFRSEKAQFSNDGNKTLTSLSQRAPPAPVSRAYPALPTWPCTHSHWQHFPRACSDQSVQWPVCPRLFHRGVWTVRRTGSKLRTFGLYHTTNWKCLMLQLFNFCLAEEKGGLSLSLTVQLSTVAEGGEGVSIPPSVVRRLLKAHVLPTSAGKLRPGSLTHHHPSLLRPLTHPTQNQPNALFSLETQMKLEIL